ncbi:MAG: hypothetical protein AB7P03_21540 [Kofleriaceae bacterium]
MSKRSAETGFTPIAETKLEQVAGGTAANQQLVSLTTQIGNSLKDVARASQNQSDPTLMTMMMLMMTSGRGGGGGQVPVAGPGLAPRINIRLNMRGRR